MNSAFKRSFSPSNMNLNLNLGANAPRRLLPVFIVSLLLILTTAYYVASLKSAVPSPREIVSSVGDKLRVSEPGSAVAAGAPVTYEYSTPATADSEKGSGALGQWLHVRPTTATPKGSGVKGCEYPILIHTSADKHCTGALALYASIVRNTLTQPEALKGKVCVHFTFVDPNLSTIEEMYKWPARENPFTAIPDCAALDSTPEYNKLVPVRWQALKPIERPKIMSTEHPNWLAALNKVHSWGIDLYERILILDADSFIITDLHQIFLEMPKDVTVAGPPDQFWDCHDRSRINGGMILMRPSRYLHVVMTELLHDPKTSCISGDWGQSEQELLNCFCGYNYHDHPVTWVPRPEFTCRIMPMYNSIWPKNYGCSDVNVLPMRSIHFTAVAKPWNVPEDKLDSRFDTKFFKCLRDNVRSGSVVGLTSCTIPPLEETRIVDDKIPRIENVRRSTYN